MLVPAWLVDWMLGDAMPELDNVDLTTGEKTLMEDGSAEVELEDDCDCELIVIRLEELELIPTLEVAKTVDVVPELRSGP